MARRKQSFQRRGDSDGSAPRAGSGSPPRGGGRSPPRGGDGSPPRGGDGSPPRGGDGSPPRDGGGSPPRERGDARETWIYGLHAVEAALANPRRRHRRLVATPAGAEALGGRTAATGAGIEILSREEIDRLLPAGAVHQGVALAAEPLPEPDLEAIVASLGPGGLVVVLDQVTDPHNVGAILRSAAAFGADAVVLPERHAPGATGVLAKTASGALDRIPVAHVTNLARTLDQLKAAGFWCIGLDSDASQAIAEADLTGRVALVLGAEGAGLRRLTRERCDLLVRLPTRPPFGSLNVSNAAAVALYEVTRRTVPAARKG